MRLARARTADHRSRNCSVSKTSAAMRPRAQLRSPQKPQQEDEQDCAGHSTDEDHATPPRAEDDLASPRLLSGIRRGLGWCVARHNRIPKLWPASSDPRSAEVEDIDDCKENHDRACTRHQDVANVMAGDTLSRSRCRHDVRPIIPGYLVGVRIHGEKFISQLPSRKTVQFLDRSICGL